MTFLVYAALGAVLFFLVLQLQTVSGYGALAAGVATLPLTICMLLLAVEGGGLAARIGPRIPMTVGPLVMASACCCSASGRRDYWADVLPGMTVFGLGLALMVAPLTATVLAALPTSTPASPAASTTRSPGPAPCSPWPRCRSRSAWAATSTPTRSPSMRPTPRRYRSAPRCWRPGRGVVGDDPQPAGTSQTWVFAAPSLGCAFVDDTSRLTKVRTVPLRRSRRCSVGSSCFTAISAPGQRPGLPSRTGPLTDVAVALVRWERDRGSTSRATSSRPPAVDGAPTPAVTASGPARRSATTRRSRTSGTGASTQAIRHWNESGWWHQVRREQRTQKARLRISYSQTGGADGIGTLGFQRSNYVHLSPRYKHADEHDGRARSGWVDSSPTSWVTCSASTTPAGSAR